MKAVLLPLAAALVLMAPAITRADTVYYEKSGRSGIESVSGKITKETKGSVEITTDKGKVVSISRDRVFKIVRDKITPKVQSAPAQSIRISDTGSAPVEETPETAAPAADPAPAAEPESAAPQPTATPEVSAAATADPTPVTPAPDASRSETSTAAPGLTVSSTVPAPTASVPTTTTSTATDSEITRGMSLISRTMDDDYEDDSPSPYHFGVKGGMNMSNLSVDPVELEESDTLNSFAVGAWWGMPLNRRFSLQTEALYTVKGDTESGPGYTATTKMSYIDVPVLAKVGFLHDSPARPSLFFGPSMAVNLSASSKLTGADSEIELDVKNEVNTFDLGLVLGGGVDFAVGGRSFGVDLRYSKGLTNVAGDAVGATAHNDMIAVMGSIGSR
ncbi:MAG: porin family protein [bacterium]